MDWVKLLKKKKPDQKYPGNILVFTFVELTSFSQSRLPELEEVRAEGGAIVTSLREPIGGVKVSVPVRSRRLSTRCRGLVVPPSASCLLSQFEFFSSKVHVKFTKDVFIQ